MGENLADTADGAGGNAEFLVTIRDLLDDAALELSAAVVPDTTLDLPVSWVHATEQLDPRPHLRTSELVCTLGSALVRPRAAAAFVSAIADSRAAGICLGLGEVHLEPPKALIEACENFAVPLLLIPHGVPFLAVNDFVRKRRTEAENDVRRAESVLLGVLFDAARSGADEVQLLAMVTEQLGADVQRAAHGWSRAQGQHPLVWTGTDPAPSEAFILQLEGVLEVAQREQERRHTEVQQQVGQLIDLISRRLAHPAALFPELETAALDQTQLLVSSWPPGSEGAILANWPGVLIGSTERDVVVVSAPELLDGILDPGLVCGYSEVVPLSALSGALREARAALRLARNRGEVVGPKQMISLEALLEQQPSELIDPFVEQLLEPILRSDRESRGDLMVTLVTFLAQDRHLQSTADQLYVHVNTVRHRLRRIHELSKRNPLSIEGVMDLHIALWTAERKKVIGHRLIRPLR